MSDWTLFYCFFVAVGYHCENVQWDIIHMVRKPPPEVLDLLLGARKLAGYVYGDETRWRSIYPLKGQLGLFRLNGQIAGRKRTIDERIGVLERRAIDAA